MTTSLAFQLEILLFTKTQILFHWWKSNWRWIYTMKRWNASQMVGSVFGHSNHYIWVFMRWTQCLSEILLSCQADISFCILCRFAYQPRSDGKAWVFQCVLWKREWIPNPQCLFHFHGFPSRVCQGYEPKWADCTVQAASIGALWAATDSAAALSTDQGNKWQDGIRQCATKLNHCQGSRDLKDLSGLLKCKADWFSLLNIISYWGEQEALKESESDFVSRILNTCHFNKELLYISLINIWILNIHWRYIFMRWNSLILIFINIYIYKALNNLY